MNFRETITNFWLSFVVSFGQLLGLEYAIELSDHSINVRMEKQDNDRRAWDPNLYKNGNIFLTGYANPIKPKSRYNEELENPDEIDVIQSDVQSEEESEEKPTEHVELISSSRYRDYMRQDLISQLLTPQEQWKLIAYAVLALGVLMIINVVVSMSAAGAF